METVDDIFMEWDKLQFDIALRRLKERVVEIFKEYPDALKNHSVDCIINSISQSPLAEGKYYGLAVESSDFRIYITQLKERSCHTMNTLEQQS